MDDTINEGATVPLPDQAASGMQPADATAAPEPAVAPPIGYDAAASPTPAAASPAATPRAARVWHVPARPVLIVLCVLASLVFLAAAFGVGVRVGAHAGRFEGRFGGRVMQAPYGMDGRYGRQNDWHGNQYQYDYRGYGGRGRISPRVLPSPNATTTP